MKLHRIHGRIVVNACVKYGKPLFVGVGDIQPDGQIYQIFCQFEQTKWREFGHFQFDPDETSKDSSEDCG